MNSRTAAVQWAVMLNAACALPAWATQYDCTDERGVRHRMSTRVDMTLIRFECVEVPGSSAPRKPIVAAQPYRSVMLTVPSADSASPVPAQWPTVAPQLRPVIRPATALATLPAGHLDTLIHQVARQFGHDPDLLRAIVKVESGFNARAVSPKGAVGLMQLMPATARRFGVEDRSDLFTPGINLQAGARYLAYLKQLFPDKLELSIAAYNAGEGAVIKRNYSIPPFPETQSYVQQVLAAYRHFRSERAMRRHG